MGPSLSNIATINQNFMNNVLQEDQENCIATTTTTQSNNVIILDGSHIQGDFTGVSNTTNTDATCLIVSNMENSVANVLAATIQQTNSATSGLFDFINLTNTTNVFDINQTITNNISQINQATCAADTTTSQNNNYIYLRNTGVGGNFIGVTNTTSSTANCSMTNNMKNTVYNQAQAAGTQSNTVQGMFTALFGTLAAIIIIIAIASIIMHSSGAISKVGYQPGPAPTVSSTEEELQAVKRLGITPEELQTLASKG